MKTNNAQGRSLVVVIGIYLIIKFLLNVFLSGGINFNDLIFTLIACFGMYTGLQYVNYAFAILIGLTVLAHLKWNLAGFPGTTIYLIEAALDIVSVVMLVANSAVKGHFTNKWSEINQLFRR